jgi:hypothetical protein
MNFEVHADTTTTMTSCFDRCAIYRHLGTMGDREHFSNAIAHFRGYRHDVAQVRSWQITACELLTLSDLLFGR